MRGLSTLLADASQMLHYSINQIEWNVCTYPYAHLSNMPCTCEVVNNFLAQQQQHFAVKLIYFTNTILMRLFLSKN